MLEIKGCCTPVTNEKVNKLCKEDDKVVDQVLCELTAPKSQCLFLVRNE